MEKDGESKEKRRFNLFVFLLRRFEYLLLLYWEPVVKSTLTSSAPGWRVRLPTLARQNPPKSREAERSTLWRARVGSVNREQDTHHETR